MLLIIVVALYGLVWLWAARPSRDQSLASATFLTLGFPMVLIAGFSSQLDKPGARLFAVIVSLIQAAVSLALLDRHARPAKTEDVPISKGNSDSKAGAEEG